MQFIQKIKTLTASNKEDREITEDSIIINNWLILMNLIEASARQGRRSITYDASTLSSQVLDCLLFKLEEEGFTSYSMRDASAGTCDALMIYW